MWLSSGFDTSRVFDHFGNHEESRGVTIYIYPIYHISYVISILMFHFMLIFFIFAMYICYMFLHCNSIQWFLFIMYWIFNSFSTIFWLHMFSCQFISYCLPWISSSSWIFLTYFYFYFLGITWYFSAREFILKYTSGVNEVVNLFIPFTIYAAPLRIASTLVLLNGHGNSTYLTFCWYFLGISGKCYFTDHPDNTSSKTGNITPGNT